MTVLTWVVSHPLINHWTLTRGALKEFGGALMRTPGKGQLPTAGKGKDLRREKKKKTSASKTTSITLILWDIMFCFNKSPDEWTLWTHKLGDRLYLKNYSREKKTIVMGESASCHLSSVFPLEDRCGFPLGFWSFQWGSSLVDRPKTLPFRSKLKVNLIVSITKSICSIISPIL